jgi:hypothetical protein
MIFYIEYEIFDYIISGIAISSLPLIQYLGFLFSIYIVEIGLAIISIPRKLQQRDQ